MNFCPVKQKIFLHLKHILSSILNKKGFGELKLDGTVGVLGLIEDSFDNRTRVEKFVFYRNSFWNQTKGKSQNILRFILI